MKFPLIVAFVIAISNSGCSQTNSNAKENASIKVGGSCEGCEVIFVSPVPLNQLNWVDTLPDYHEKGPKLVISGIIYQVDGKTPAKDVVLYIYHTDQTGKYTNRNSESGVAGRNGYIKGWIRTNSKGQYKFFTLKPAPYPGSNIPSHIHPIIKEPGKTEYWIDEFLFDDDVFLTSSERQKQQGRGGIGILKTVSRGGILYAERNIVLGKNIPDYPVNN